MKAAVVPHHGKLVLMEMSDPAPGPYECLVRIDACAICTGTDSNIIAGTFPWLTETPFVLGHESTGIVVEVGEKVRNFKMGQRVTRPAGVLPGQRRDGIGSNWGGFAELGLVHDSDAAIADGLKASPSPSRIPLPDAVDAVSAALSVNQREILSVSRRIAPTRRDRVVVIGSGYNGMLFSLYLKHCGAGSVLMIGSGARADLARKTFEADAFLDYREEYAFASVRSLLGGDPTHLIDAVGTVKSLTLAKSLAGPGCAFGRYGLHEYGAIGPLTKELEAAHPALNMAADELGATDEWCRLWKDGFFERDGISDGAVPFDQIVAAFERLARREVMKLVVMM